MKSNESKRRLLSQISILSLTIVCIWLIASCESDNKSNGTLNENARIEVRDYLSSISKRLATNSVLDNNSPFKKITETNILNQFQNTGKVNISKILSDVPDKLTVGGIEYQINVEAFNENSMVSLLKRTSSTEPVYAVATDCDLFYDGTSNELPYAEDIDDISDEFNAAKDMALESLEYPLLVVTIEEIIDEESLDYSGYEGASSMSKTGSVPWLVLYGVMLKTERDGNTKEEFELYFRKSDIPNIVFNGYPYYFGRGQTIHIFNGGNRKDARNTIGVTYPDVNKKNVLYQVPAGQEIYLHALSSFDLFMIPWEDDLFAGKLARKDHSWFPQPKQFYPVGLDIKNKIYDEVYNAANEQKINNYGLTSKVEIALPDNWWNSWAFDQDDSYSKSPCINLTLANMEARTGNGVLLLTTDYAVGGGLGHIKYHLGLKYTN
jgi:hypothetical protein